MALFRFRTRNPDRDRQTDAARQGRLEGFLDELCAEIERERDGLQDRYEKITADAAFSQQALEDRRVPGATSSRIDEMTESMMRYTERLELLERQIGFLAEMREQAALFPKGEIGDQQALA